MNRKHALTRVHVDLFCEDRAHRELLGALVERIVADEARTPKTRIRSAIGGRPRVFAEMERYLTSVTHSRTTRETPDLIVISIDGNCSSFQKTREQIMDTSPEKFRDRLIPACPDPHIER